MKSEIFFLKVFVGTLDLAAVHSVEQRIVMVDDENKFFELKNFFHSELTSESKVVYQIYRI